MYSDLTVSKLDEAKTRVCIIYTGGTIGMVPRNPNFPNQGLKPASLNELLAVKPGLGKDEGIEIGMISFDNPVDSSDLHSENWIVMGKIVKEYYKAFDGFVILHGTDTMAFTTSALSFILRGLNKPIVVTGSQLPIKHPRTDAIKNLTQSLYIAGYKAFDEIPKIPEVVLCFDELILRGNRATKYSADHWAGFNSPNLDPLGTIGEHIKIRKNLISKGDADEDDFFADLRLAKRIKTIMINPGMSPLDLKEELAGDHEGAILLTYGTGNMPTSSNYIQVIKDAIIGNKEAGFSRPKTILNITQCHEGSVEMGLYEASSGLLEVGVTSGLDLTYEAGLAKMYWCLGKYEGRDAQEELQKAVAGEQSFNLIEIFYDLTKLERTTSLATIVTPYNKLTDFVSANLYSAIIRLQGLDVSVEDNDKEASIRIYLNHPKANETTGIDDHFFALEFKPDDIQESKNAVFNISHVARHKTIINEGRVCVSLVAINAEITCKEIYINFYTEAEF